MLYTLPDRYVKPKGRSAESWLLEYGQASSYREVTKLEPGVWNSCCAVALFYERYGCGEALIVQHRDDAREVRAHAGDSAMQWFVVLRRDLEREGWL